MKHSYPNFKIQIYKLIKFQTEWNEEDYNQSYMLFKNWLTCIDIRGLNINQQIETFANDFYKEYTIDSHGLEIKKPKKYKSIDARIIEDLKTFN